MKNKAGQKQEVNSVDRIQALAEQASQHIKEMICDSTDEISAAMLLALEQSQETGTGASVSIGYRVKIDLQTNKVQHTLAFSTKHQLQVEEEMPDPDQYELIVKE